MKRCIICGNVGSDDSTVCEVCGNPYLDIRESDYSGGEPDEGEQTEDTDVVYEEDAAYEEDTDEKDADENKTAEQEQNASGQADDQRDAFSEGTMTEQTEERTEVQQKASAEDVDVSVPLVGGETMEMVSDSDQYTVPYTNTETEAAADEEAVRVPHAEAPASQAAPLRGEPHIYGQNDSERQGAKRMTSGAIRREMGSAYEGSRADAPARGAARPADVRRPEQMRRRMPGEERPAGRNAAAPDRTAAGQRRPVQPGRPTGEYAAQQAGPMGGQGAPGRNQAAVRSINVQGGPVNMQNRPAGAYVNASRPVNYAAQRMAMSARGILRSPLLILIALLQTAYLVGAVMATVLNQVDYSQIVRLLANVNFPAQIAGYTNGIIGVISKIGSRAAAVNLIAHLPDLLLCIGLWITVFAARTKKEKMSGTGIGLWRAYVIIGMIGACITMLAGLVVGVALVVSAWASGAKSVIAVSVIVMILLVVVTMLVVMYYFSYLATLKTFHKNANGETYGTASGYVAVVHVIAGLFGIINLLSGIVNSEVGTMISAVGQIGWMVLFGVWIFLYRTKMSGAEE